MSIHKLKYHEFLELIEKMELKKLNVKPLGYFDLSPFQDKNYVDKLYEEYSEREKNFENYIDNVLKTLTDYIIFAEASQMGNSNYVYHKKDRKFIHKGNKPKYFQNVEEAEWGKSIIIDFFSPFGINHTSNSREYLNKVQQYKEYTEFFFDRYFKSILNHKKLKNFKLTAENFVIKAPAKTRGSILKYLRLKYKVDSLKIKCYTASNSKSKPKKLTVPKPKKKKMLKK